MTLTQRLTGVPATQWLLRLTMISGLVGTLLAAGAAGHPPHVAYFGLVAALALLAAVFPESGVTTFAMVLVAAALLLGAHVSGLLCSYGPDRVPVSAALVRRWFRRAILVLPVAPAVYLAAATAPGDAVSSDVPSEVWVVSVLIASAAAVLAATQLRPSEPVG